MPKTTKPQRTWIYAPRKATPPPVPEALKREMDTKANALIESVLMPQHVLPPPEDPQFNYIENLYTQWYHSYFYFCAHYVVAGPNTMMPSFEHKFARLTYVGGARFNLSAMHYTGEWIEIFPDLMLDECLDAVRDDPWFHP